KQHPNIQRSFFEENEKEKHKRLKDRKMRKEIKESQAIYSPVVAPRQNKQGVSKNNQKKKNRFITSSTAILFKSSNNDKKLLPR
ncbi:hypothetical protein, partial [Bacteroides pyogenes]|uniref:hypothetical protein n=2 Tax=Bacteroides pyogenes TaxID=310300 RepID=UPI002A91967D